MAAIAVTGYVDRDQRRWPLGHYAGMTTSTIGRQATSLGTVNAVGDRSVMIDGSSNDGICGPLIGNVYPASSAPMPPFHASCECLLVPT